jgi:hypothetical protein
LVKNATVEKVCEIYDNTASTPAKAVPSFLLENGDSETSMFFVLFLIMKMAPHKTFFALSRILIVHTKLMPKQR